MKEFQNIRAEIAKTRLVQQEQERGLQEERAELKAVRMQLAALGRTGQASPEDDHGAALLETQQALKLSIRRRQQGLDETNAALFEQLGGLLSLADPAKLVEQLDDSVPFLLMPVRLETRFIHDPQKGNELWVRIFPDDIHTQTHEEALSTGEAQAGRAYWDQVWRSGNDQIGQQGAWRALVNAVGQTRGAWIARALTPTNPEDKPAERLPPEQELDPAPEFPEISAREASWSLAPRAGAMPDRFVVMLFSGNDLAHQAVGNPIPDPLFVGPDPGLTEENFEQLDGDLTVDPKMEWMVDFQKAVDIGMGLRIGISEEESTNGFTRVLALGLRLSSDEQESQLELERLLDNHHYSDGLSLLPVGMPTNNTSTAKSGFSSTQIESEDSYKVERCEPLFPWEEEDFLKKDGQRLAEALGIRFPTLHHIAFSDRAENHEAQAMNRALWAATFGYFLEEMMGPSDDSGNVQSIFGLDTIYKIRGFFTRFVSGRGPLAALRVGNQPYGVLPTTAFSSFRWNFEDSPDATHAGLDNSFMDALFHVLQRMDTHWGILASRVSRVGVSQDPDQEMLDILGLHASAVEYYQRFAAGPDYWQNLGVFRGLVSQSQTFNRLLKEVAGELLGELGFKFPYLPKIFNLTFFRDQTPLGALVQDGPLSENDPLEPISATIGNYIQWLADCKDDDQLRDQDFGLDDEGKKIPPPNALLYLFMRHALLQQAWDAVMKVAVGGGLASLRDRREVEMLNMRTQPDTTRWDYFQAEMPGDLQGVRIGQFLFSDEAVRLTEAAELREVQESLATLANLPTARLERLTAEHFDLCSYRLDAWQLGMVNARLQAMRSKSILTSDGPAEGANDGQVESNHRLGIFLGAYGWLEELKPASSRKRIEDSNLPEEFHDPEAPLYIDSANQGHIHAPSLNHASTAAVLRNAYLTHAEADNAGLMSVNLSSERVRRALWYLDGMRNGQELGALLGYQFERGLHDRNATLAIDQYILPIRRKYALEADHVTPSEPGDSIEALEARNVVDGLKLLKASRSPGYPYDVRELPASGPIRVAIEDELRRMADSMDGLSDVALSESVFQAVQGNYERSGAILKAISEGNRPYDELDVVRTPRSGLGLTHRVAIVFDTNDPETSNWPGLLTPRAAFEARLNRWVGERLGLPENIRCLGRYTDQATDIEQTEELKLSALGLQPLDLLYIAPQNLSDEATELEKRLVHHLRTAKNLTEDIPVSLIHTERSASWTTDVLSLFEVSPLLNQLRTLVTGSRALGANDLKPPADNPENQDDPVRFDLVELTSRLNTLLSDVDDALIALNGAADPASMRTALLQAAQFDLPDAIPDSAIETTPETDVALTERVASVIKELESRKTSCISKQTASQDPALKPPQVVRLLIEAAQEILGRAFRVLPLFEAENSAEVQLALDAHDTLVAGGPALAVEEWIDGLARVRPKLGAYKMMGTLTDAFENLPAPLRVAQLPYKENDRWLAFPLVEGQDLSREALSLVLQAAPGYRADRKQCGLMVDEFTEVLPGKEETTGLALHFNQPSSEPPQALMLVVPPVLRGHWQWEDLVAALNETLDMSQKRAVEPDLLGTTAYAQLLPAILTAVTRYPATISLDLADNKFIKRFLSDSFGG